jgi:nicotinamidase-related amidase
MTAALALAPSRTALLVMDVQSAVVEMIAHDREGLLARTVALLGAARAAQVRVVHVVVGFRPGFPEVSSNNLSCGAIRASGRFAPGSAGTEIHPAVAPRPDEVIVTKHRVSAFAGTDLDIVLRANAIDTLVLAGIATSGVVLSTLRHAADADYRLVVAHDCCADRDAEVHRVLCEKVFPRQATIASAADIAAALA